MDRKKNNVTTLTTKNNTTYKNHKRLLEYTFDLNHIRTCWTRVTKAFPWVLIWFEPHMNDFGSTYVQPLTFINTYVISITHTHTDSHTHTYTYKFKNTLSLICSYPFRPCSQMYALKKPNPNLICEINVHQTNPNPKPNPNKKCTTNRTNSKTFLWFNISLQNFLWRDERSHSHQNFHHRLLINPFVFPHV